jgi:CrcB protein
VRVSVVGAVFAGGCVGGVLRYAAGEHWATSPYDFPWPTFGVNVAGAFILALLIVVVSDVLGPSTYLRPLVGTGFCGALTTFSSVVVVADRMFAHGHACTATVYLVVTIAAGLAAGVLGITTGRTFGSYRRNHGDEKGGA